MPHVFGKSLKFSFTPIIDNEPTGVDSLVSARLFSQKPNDAEIENPALTPTYFVDGTVTWEDRPNFEKIISFDAVTDPDPHSQDEYETYYIAINFKYESGGSTVFALEAIDIFRPDGLTSNITTRFDDVFSVEPKLEDYYKLHQINRFIEDSKKDIFRWYKGLGYPKKSLLKMSELNDACRYRAASKACFSLYTSSAPEWLEKFKEHRESYYDALKSAQPLVSEDKTGEDPIDAPSSKVAFLLR